jgi:hypothetical protein
MPSDTHIHFMKQHKYETRDNLFNHNKKVVQHYHWGDTGHSKKWVTIQEERE